jgi:hypothetical protein
MMSRDCADDFLFDNEQPDAYAVRLFVVGCSVETSKNGKERKKSLEKHRNCGRLKSLFLCVALFIEKKK